MRALLVPATMAAAIAFATTSFAASSNTTGMVKAFDLKAQTLTLQDGTVYKLPSGFKDPGLKIGEKVQITWEMKNSTHQADAVKIVQ